MNSTLCPHGCGVTYERTAAQLNGVALDREPGKMREVWVFKCPGCDGHVVEIVIQALSSQTNQPNRPPEYQLIWPLRGRTAPPEVPEPLRSDFAEAATILNLSPQASAALSRRCLQSVLVNHLDARGGNLENQIDFVFDSLPSHIGELLHGLRVVGNFGAHEIKDKQTGVVVAVEPGEAEWTLNALESLLDHVFVAPARAANQRAELNERLARTNKPQLGPDGKPIKQT